MYRGPISRPQIRRRLAAFAALATLAFAGSVAATAAAVDPGRGDEDPAAASGAGVSPTPEATTTTAPAPEPPAPTKAADTGDEPDPRTGAGLLVRPSPTVYTALAASPTTVLPRPRPAKLQARRHPSGHQPAAPEAVFWLNQLLPDPTPPSLRLEARFARELRVTADREGVDWALVLAVLRARGRLGAVSAGPLGLNGVAALLARAGARSKPVARTRAFHASWTAADRAIDAAHARRNAYRANLAPISRHPEFTDRAVALALYYRAVGLRALQSGLEATKARLARRLLRDARISI